MSDLKTETAKQPPSPTVTPVVQPQPAPKTVPMTIWAGFTGLPGTTKTGTIETAEENALWLGLHLQSIQPKGSNATPAQGVSRGHSTLMTTYDAPLAGKEGLGTLAARLKYASDVATSFDVKIDGLDRRDVEAAKAEASKMIVNKSGTTGDVAAIAGEVEQVLTEKYVKPVKVTITPTATKANIRDVGERELFYRIHGPTTLHMNVKAVPGGEQTVSTDKSVATSSGGEHEAEVHGGAEQVETTVHDVKTGESAHREHSTTAVAMAWRQEAAQTLTELTKSFENGKDTFTQEITTKIDNNYRRFEGEHDVTHTTQLTHDDGTSHEVSTTDEGDKEKKNFFSHLSDVLNVVNVVTAPFGLNPMWKFGIGAGKAISGLFAVNGKVHYTDATRDGDSHQHGGETTHVDGTHAGHEVIKDKRDERTRITQTVGKHLDALTVHLAKATQEVHGAIAIQSTGSSGGGAASRDTDDYHATQTKQGAGGSMHTKANQYNTTTLHYAVTAKETFLHPELVVSANGGIDLNDARFPDSEKEP